MRSGEAVGRRAEALAGGGQARHRAPVPVVGEEEVDEARARRPRSARRCRRRSSRSSSVGEPGGDVARVFAERRGEQHRRVGAVVAQLRLRRAVEGRLGAGRLAVAQGAGGRLTAARSSAIGSLVAFIARIVWTAGGRRGYAGRRARRRDHRRPRQPARARSRARRRSTRPAWRRSGASATSSATGPSPTPAPTWSGSAATSAWSATTTWRCSAPSTSPPSRRPPPRRSSWTRENVAERTLEFLRELEPNAERARASASSTPPRATRSGSTCSRASRPTPAWTRSPKRICLIGHSHVALFFTRPAGEAAGETRGAQAGDGAAARSRPRQLAGQPGQRRPAARRRPARRLAGARHRSGDRPLPPRPLRHRARRRADRRRRPAEPARRPPLRRPVTRQLQAKSALKVVL